MSVGDLKNNLRKLQSELRGCKYDKDINVDSISKGVVGEFLPIYHYIFLEYSHKFAAEVAELNIELAGKSDLRFVEAMYKVLREVFSYKPPITKEQLFGLGFTERKVMMCTDILNLVKTKYKPNVVKTGITSSKGNLGPRASETASTTSQPKTPSADTESSVDAAAKLPPLPPGRVRPDALAVQVVNEIRKTVASSIPSDPQPIKDVPRPSNMPDIKFSVEQAYVGEDSSLLDQAPPPVTVETKVVREDIPVQKRAAQVAWEDMKVVVVNVGEQKEGASYNPARYGSTAEVRDTSDEEDDLANSQTLHPRPIDIIPKTPAHRPASSKLNISQDADSHMMQTVMEKVQIMEKSVGDFLSRIKSIDNRLRIVEGLLSIQQEQEERNTNKMAALSPEQLETLLARMTLVENKVAMVVGQQQSMKTSVQLRQTRPKSMNYVDVRYKENVPACKVLSSIQVPNLPFSPIMHQSPTQNAKHTEPETCDGNASKTPEVALDDDQVFHGRWSSTPTELNVPLLESQHVISKEKSQITTQATRISNLLKETESILNVQVVSPLKISKD